MKVTAVIVIHNVTQTRVTEADVCNVMTFKVHSPKMCNCLSLQIKL